MKYFRLFLGVLLLPLAAAMAWQFFDLSIGLGAAASANVLPFWLGLAGYFVFQAAFFRPIKTYVFGHELTHAVVGVLSGAKLKSFKVRENGGSVVLTKTSVWIALAPYFVPLYTLALVASYAVASQFRPLEGLHSYYLFLAGFSLAFHLSLTHYALLQGQSDLKQFGVFFSSVVILIINCVTLTVVLKLLFRDGVSIEHYLFTTIDKMVAILHYVSGACSSIIIQRK